jgi:hypothetical protein
MSTPVGGLAIPHGVPVVLATTDLATLTLIAVPLAIIAGLLVIATRRAERIAAARRAEHAIRRDDH